MASADMKLSLVLTGRDEGAKRLLEQTQQAAERMAQSRAALSRAHRPYAIAGIRSGREIRREIMQTEAAYNRLARSGRASHNDLARVATATRQRIAELNNELNQGTQAQSKWGARLGKLGQAGAAVAAGGTAAYMAVSPELERYKQLDTRLRETTWAAFGEQRGSDTQWLATEGLGEIRTLIKTLAQTNGGNNDLAIDTVQGMLANGMSFDQVKQNALSTHQLALAAGENGQYDGAAAAKLAKVFADNGLDVAKASQMAAQSGMQGTFEIADMVRELPGLLPDAKAAGFVGEEGFAFLLSSLQSASNKAGSTGEAANNVKNALQKALSADTTKRMDKLLKERGDKQDWQQMVLAGQKEGKNAMQVLGDFAQQLLAADRQFQAAKKRADGGDEAAKQEMVTMQAFMISRLLPDMQARGGLNAMIDQKQMAEYYNGLMGNKTDVIGGKNAFMSTGAAARQEQADALKEMALQESKTFESLAEAETQFKNLAAEFPVATEALQALAAAATAAAVAQGAMGLLGKGGGVLGKRGVSGGTAGKLGGMWQGVKNWGGRAVGGMKSGLQSGAQWALNNPRTLGAAGLMLYSGKLNEGESEIVEQGKQAYLAAKARGETQKIVFRQPENRQATPSLKRPEQYPAPAVGRPDRVLGAPQTAARPIAVSVPPTASALSGIAALLRGAPNAGVAKPAEPPEKLTPVITQQTTAYQTAINAQTTSFQAALQADTAAVSGKLDAINGTLGGLQQTIQLTSTLNLDGRIIANEVSRHAVAMFGRGAGQ